MSTRLFIAMLLFVSCTKEKQEQLSLRVAGVYQCMKVDFYWSNLQPVVLDTVGNESLEIVRINDSVLSVNNIQLTYSGLYPDGHTWLPPGLGNSYSLTVSPTLNRLRFRYETGGLGGGSGYYLEWNK